MRTVLQGVIDQIGYDAVKKSCDYRDVHIANCDLHGKYAHLPGTAVSCPLCPAPNGDSATDVEHYIDMNFVQNLGTNPQQKLNPMGI